MKKLALILLSAAAAFAADPGLMKLVMPEARVVSGVNVAQIKKSPFGRFLLNRFSASSDQGFDEFVKASGFDPRNDLDEFLIASPGAASGARRLVLARGTFVPERILQIARTAGASVSPYQGIDVLSNEAAVSAVPNTVPMAIAFLDGKTAIAGDTESVRNAIGRRQTGAGPDREIATRAQAVSAASDAWFVSTVPVAELAQGLPDARLGGALKGDALKSIRQASGGLVFGDALRVSLELVTGNAEDAASLAGLLRFLAGFAQMGSNRQQAEAGALLSTLDLKTDGSAVVCALSIPEAQLERLLTPAR